MKIVVLAGGLSPERNVSLSSGAKVCQALRERGHQAAFVDLYFGTEHFDGPAQDLFQAPLPGELTRVARQAPDLEAVKRQRANGGESMFGPGCAGVVPDAPTWCFWPSTAPAARTAGSRRPWICWECPTPASGYLGSAIAMDKDLTKRLVAALGVATPRLGDGASITDEGRRPAGSSARLELPCVVKPVDSGSSIGVYPSARTAEELRPGPGRQDWPWGAHRVLEEYVSGPGDPGGHSGGHSPALH